MPRPRTTRTVYIAGQRWKIIRARLRLKYGECDYDTRTIRIDERLTGRELLDTLIHELVHARWPDLHEQAVIEFSNIAAEVLYAERFRRAGDQEDD
ncbi:MAG: hypothetical protein HQ464_02615 [Planctomycetes bacterium]|nr:hypothetical protein [Planctomycetota bacterium]